MMNFKSPKVVLLLVTAITLCGLSLQAQKNDLVRLEGKVFDSDSKNIISYFMIVNKSTGSGTFGDPNGSFILNASLQDTIIIGAHGYQTETFILPSDPPQSALIARNFYLEKVTIALPEVVIIPERELEEIKKDIDELGYDESDYRISGVNAVEHPITFLYQAFSKRERSYRKVAELENEARRRDLLKELFKKYVDYDIISLANEDFDNFIDYCNLTDYQMQNSTQYDFIKLIKARYRGWEIYSKRFKATQKFKKIE